MRYSLIPMSLLLLGCVPVTSQTVSREAGRELFVEHCAMCHGRDATGSGPLAKTLETPPADLTGIASRRDGVWPMLEIMSIIDGYSKRTGTREDMPAIAALNEGPMVAFDTGNGRVVATPARLIAVAGYLESIQSPPAQRSVP